MKRHDEGKSAHIPLHLSLLHVNVNRDEVNLDLLSGQWERAYLVTSEWESFFALLKTKDEKRVSRMFRANVAPCTAKGMKEAPRKLVVLFER